MILLLEQVLGLLSASILTRGSCLVIDEGYLTILLKKSLFFKQIQGGYRDGGFNMVFGLPKNFLSEGCCIGGGSIVNSAYTKGPDSVWNLWRTEYNLSLRRKILIMLIKKLRLISQQIVVILLKVIFL